VTPEDIDALMGPVCSECGDTWMDEPMSEIEEIESPHGRVDRYFYCAECVIERDGLCPECLEPMDEDLKCRQGCEEPMEKDDEA
jgi:hypothetical protein